MGRNRKKDRHLPQYVSLEHGTFYFRKGKDKRKTLGNDFGVAMAKYGELISEHWRGRTIGDIIDRYRTEVLPQKRSEHNREVEGEQLNKLKIGFGHILPDNLTAKEVFKYRDARRSKARVVDGVKIPGRPIPTAARHEVVLLGHVLSMGIEWGVGTVNVVRTIKPGSKIKRKKRAFVPASEVDKVKALANPRMKLAIDWAILIGQRRGDLLKLLYSDLRADGIYVQQGKTEAELLIGYSPAVEALIARCKAMKPHIPRVYLLQTREGKPYSADGFSAIWQRLMKKHVAAGGQRFTFHDLRAVSANAAATLEEAQTRLGHTSSETTQRHYRTGVTKAKPAS